MAEPSAAPDVCLSASTVDTVVIGAGFTGLACARRLAEHRPQDRIAVFDTERLGHGLSGRNSGFLIDRSFYTSQSSDNQARLTRLQTSGLDHLRELVAEHDIDCGWNEIGYLRAALSPYEEQALRDKQALYEADGITPEILSADEINAIMGTSAYRIGLRHGRTTLVQPVQLVRGLARSLPQNVTVHETCPVSNVTRKNDLFELQAGDTQVTCRQVFLCCNGGVPALGHAKNRQVEVATFAAVTPVLDASHGAIGTVPEFGYLPSFPGGPTIRKTRDNRLLIREHLSFTPGRGAGRADYASFLRTARRSMSLRWQSLRKVPFEIAWHGVMPLTRNGARVFGQISDNLFATAFCNGAGVTAGTAAGMALADLGSNRETAILKDQSALPQANRVPPHWLLNPFVSYQIAAAERSWRRAYEGI